MKSFTRFIRFQISAYVSGQEFYKFVLPKGSILNYINVGGMSSTWIEGWGYFGQVFVRDQGPSYIYSTYIQSERYWSDVYNFHLPLEGKHDILFRLYNLGTATWSGAFIICYSVPES